MDPPAHILDLRETVRLRQTLMETGTEWQQPLHAALYHHGVAKPTGELTSAANRQWLGELALPASTRQLITVGLSQIDAARAELAPIDRWLARYAKAHPACRALAGHYGVGPITAPTLLAEIGDARRFGNGDAIVRYAGLDITVYSSDGKRSPGQLAKQGPGTLRWALFEAAKLHSRRGAPEHALYRDAKRRRDGQRAALTGRASSPAKPATPSSSSATTHSRRSTSTMTVTSTCRRRHEVTPMVCALPTPHVTRAAGKEARMR